jgi:hypothetical protein
LAITKKDSGTITDTAIPIRKFLLFLLLLIEVLILTNRVRLVHVQPEIAVCKECYNEPDEQSQRYQHRNKEVLEFITKVHENRYDIASLEKRQRQEEESNKGLWHVVAEEHTEYYFGERHHKKDPEHLPYAAYLLPALCRVGIAVKVMVHDTGVQLGLISFVKMLGICFAMMMLRHSEVFIKGLAMLSNDYSR